MIHRTPQEFIDSFQAYIDECKASKRLPTIPGACVAMGYKTKQSFYDQKKRKVKGEKKPGVWVEAVELCSMIIEDQLINDRTTMAIFVLKSKWEYKDKFHLDNTHSGPDGKPIEHKWQVEVIDNAQDKDPA